MHTVSYTCATSICDGFAVWMPLDEPPRSEREKEEREDENKKKRNELRAVVIQWQRTAVQRQSGVWEIRHVSSSSSVWWSGRSSARCVSPRITLDTQRRFSNPSPGKGEKGEKNRRLFVRLSSIPLGLLRLLPLHLALRHGVFGLHERARPAQLGAASGVQPVLHPAPVLLDDFLYVLRGVQMPQ